MKKIGVIGECMVELSELDTGLCTRSFGGDTLNTAVYMARCAGDGLGVHYATVLGDDPLSEQMLQSWREEGIHVDTVDRISGCVPGLYMIQTDDQGERSFLYWRDQAPAKKFLQTQNAITQKEQLLSFDWLYFSGISLAILEPHGRQLLFDLLTAFKANGGKIAYDGNYRPRLWPLDDAQLWMERAYRLCDIALPSVDDECALWGDNSCDEVLERLESFGCPEIVLKRGADSCLVSESGTRSEFATQAVEQVVDTTAAGDSFCAAYLAQRLTGGSIPEAVAAGQRLSAQVIQKKGAIVAVEC